MSDSSLAKISRFAITVDIGAIVDMGESVRTSASSRAGGGRLPLRLFEVVVNQAFEDLSNNISLPGESVRPCVDACSCSGDWARRREIFAAV